MFEGGVILYGAGFALFWYVNYLKKHDIHISYIVDSDTNKQGKKYQDIPIVSWEYCIQNVDLKNVDIIITAPRFTEEILQVIEPYITKERVFSFECELYDSFITDIDQYRKFLLDHWNDIVSLYNNLGDDKSRVTLDAVLRGRISANQEYFKSVMEADQYYVDDIFTLSKEEVVVELGSNDGQTLKAFLEKVNGQFKHFYCFEPDKTCIEKLKAIIASISNIILVEKGAWNKTETLFFYSDAEHGASKMCDQKTASYSIEVAAVDDVIDDSVTFIKMDIEGAELMALEGAKEIIKRNKPKLAVCIYHKNEDIIDIPKYISSLVPEYKFYIRHHNWGGTETVLYAVADK